MKMKWNHNLVKFVEAEKAQQSQIREKRQRKCCQTKAQLVRVAENLGKGLIIYAQKRMVEEQVVYS